MSGTATDLLIALGANLPQAEMLPSQTLFAAIAAIAESGLPVLRVSRIYVTPCFPSGAGPDYVNAALVADGTGRSPAEVLDLLHRIENRFGRERVQRWGMRTLDLDLIAMGDLVLPDAAMQTHWRDLPSEDQIRATPDRLILPHPRLQDRAFVLVPLADVAPDWQHPLLRRSVAQMCDDLPADMRAEVVPM